MKIYNVLWSGGVDSTFVVTQLSQYPVVIRPFYIKGQTFRLSEPQELSAIKAIRELLIADERTKAEIMEPEIIEASDPRIKDREVVKAWRRIYMRLLERYKAEHNGKLPAAGSQQIYADGAYISPQYASFASLTKNLNSDFEIGIIYADHVSSAFNSSDSILIEYDELTERKVLRLRDDISDKDSYTLFKDMRLPIAGQGMDKRDVWKWYSDHGYLMVRSKTNFCQAPISTGGGAVEPCGVCTPCICVIREGVLEPFTEAGLARYRDYEENHEREPERFRLKGF